MKKLKSILNKLHIHRFNMPILSQYRSFGTRHIVYQCKCGKKELHKIYRNFGDSFPMPTTNFIENKDVQKVLDNPICLPQIITFEDRMKFLS